MRRTLPCRGVKENGEGVGRPPADDGPAHCCVCSVRKSTPNWTRLALQLEGGLAFWAGEVDCLCVGSGAGQPGGRASGAVEILLRPCFGDEACTPREALVSRPAMHRQAKLHAGIRSQVNGLNKSPFRSS